VKQEREQLLYAQRLQAAVHGLSQVLWPSIWDPLPSGTCQASLGHDPDLLPRPVPGVHRLPCQPFAIVEVRFAQAIDVRRVQQPDPALEGVVDHRNGIRLRWPAFRAEP